MSARKAGPQSAGSSIVFSAAGSEFRICAGWVMFRSQNRDGLEGVGHAKGRIAEVLQLLKDRVGQPGQEIVAAKHQHRQAVGMGQGGSGQQVRGAGPAEAVQNMKRRRRWALA